MENFTDADYMQAKRVCKDFEIKDLGEYHKQYKAIHHCYLMYLRTFKICVLNICT